MVSLELTPNSEIGNGQENNDMDTFLQTVGHQQFAMLEGFTACLTAGSFRYSYSTITHLT